MKIYLAGPMPTGTPGPKPSRGKLFMVSGKGKRPMRGIPDANFPAFFAAANMLRDAGHEVFSPVEAPEKGLAYRQYLMIDLNWIGNQAQAIALLPGWEKSFGANVEWSLARALDLKFIYL
jgi:hypothetical protein